MSDRVGPERPAGAPPETRTASARWDGGMRATTDAGGFAIVTDEPAQFGGGGTGPQPTDLFLASVAGCFALSLAHVARKRGLALTGLTVDAVGTYAGLAFAGVEVRPRWDGPAEVLADLVPAAERVCYVTNSLRRGVAVTITTDGRAPAV